MRRLILFAFIGFTFLSNAQQQQKEFSKTEEDKIESRKFKNNFFTQMGFTIALDLMSTDARLNEYDHEQILKESTASIFTYTYDLRYNLFSYRDFFSISISSPLSAGIYSAGLGIKLPMCVDFNFFAHSTFNNINSTGFYMGIGVHQFVFTNESFNGLTQNFVRLGLKYPYRSRNAYIEFMAGQGKLVEFDYIGGSYSGRSYYFKLTLGRLLKM